LPSRFGTFTRGIVIVVLLVILFAALRNGGWTKFDANNVAALPDKEQAATPSSAGPAKPPKPHWMRTFTDANGQYLLDDDTIWVNTENGSVSVFVFLYNTPKPPPRRPGSIGGEQPILRQLPQDGKMALLIFGGCPYLSAEPAKSVDGSAPYTLSFEGAGFKAGPTMSLSARPYMQPWNFDDGAFWDIMFRTCTIIRCRNKDVCTGAQADR
jgi:hypothetical protein